MPKEAWPEIPYPPWRDTCSALHLWLQIVGKYRLARSPWVNHSWHATFYVTPRGLTTGTVPDGGRLVTVDFDFCDHRLVARSDCNVSVFALEAMSTADFLEKAKRAIEAVGGNSTIHGVPNEIPHPIPFALSRAPGFSRGSGGAGRGPLRREPRGVPPPLRSRAHVGGSGRHPAPLPALHLRGGSGRRWLAPRSARMRARPPGRSPPRPPSRPGVAAPERISGRRARRSPPP